MITIDKAKELHKRFFLGELTQAELAELAAFAASPACPAEWQGERRMFAAMLAAKRVDSAVEATDFAEDDDFWFDTASALDNEDEAPCDVASASLPDGFANRLSAHIRTTVAHGDNEVPRAAIVPATPMVSKPRTWKWIASISAFAACLSAAVWLGLRVSYDRTVVVHRPSIAVQTPAERVPTSLPPLAQPTIAKASGNTCKDSPATNSAPARTVKAEKPTRLALSIMPSTSAITETQRAFYTPTALSAAEAEEQLRLIVSALQEARSDVAMPDSLVFAMDWDAWLAATYDSDLSEN